MDTAQANKHTFCLIALRRRKSYSQTKVINNRHIEEKVENQVPLPVLLPELRGPNGVTFPTIK